MNIDSYKTHHWAYEVEPGLILEVDYEEGAAEEDVTITIKDRKIKLWSDEVAPLVEMLRAVALTHQGHINADQR